LFQREGRNEAAVRYVYRVCCHYASKDKTRQTCCKLLKEDETKRKMGVKGKAKDRVHLRTDHEGPDGKNMSSYILSSTSALDGVGGQRHDPVALPPGKTP
jgi:hypothetical protein